MTSPRNSTTTKSGRFYTWRGQQYDSVTTVLKALPSEALIGWAKKYTSEFAIKNLDELTALVEADQAGAVDWLKGASYRSRDAAADLGTEVHDAIEAHILGKPMPEWPLLIRARMEQFARFLERWQPEFQMAEASVYSRTHSYAGTLDSIAKIGGVTVLLDVKTRGGTNYPISGQSESRVYDKDALQLAAYRHAEFIGLADGEEFPMPRVDAAAVLRLTNTDYELVEVDAGRETFGDFLAVKRVHAGWLNGRSKHVILGEFPVSIEAAYPGQMNMEEVA